MKKLLFWEMIGSKDGVWVYFFWLCASARLAGASWFRLGVGRERAWVVTRGATFVVLLTVWVWGCGGDGGKDALVRDEVEAHGQPW